MPPSASANQGLRRMNNPVDQQDNWSALTPRNCSSAARVVRHRLERCRSGCGGSRNMAPIACRLAKRRSALLRLLLQFHNVLLYVLLAASVVTASLGHWVDTGVILAVVVINAVIGFIQEGKAEQAMNAVRKMLSLQATVIRGGRRLVVDAETLVPGDIALLQSGDKVSADLRLIRVKTLQIDEAALTGESVPVEKDITAVAPDALLGDRASMAYAGTVVTYGQGTGVVVATGEATEIGRISAMLSEVESLTTPLLQRMDEFGQMAHCRHSCPLVCGIRDWHVVLELSCQRDVHGGGRVGCRRHSGGLAGDHYDHPRDRRRADGAPQGYHPPVARGRDTRGGDDDLFGQDRHADAQ